MNSIIQIIVNAIFGFIKAVFSMTVFFFKMVWSFIRIIISVMPITGCMLTVMIIFQISGFLLGRNPLPDTFPVSVDITLITALWQTISSWWSASFSSYKGSAIYYLIIILSAVLFVPVVGTVFIAASLYAILAFLKYTIFLDLIWYVLQGLIRSESPFAQITSRFYSLFPAIAERHYEKSYHRWLKHHQDDFSNNNSFNDFNEYDGRDYNSRNARKRRAIDRFYDEDSDDERYDNDSDDRYDDDSDDERYDDDSDDERYNDDSDDKRYDDDSDDERYDDDSDDECYDDDSDDERYDDDSDDERYDDDSDDECYDDNHHGCYRNKRYSNHYSGNSKRYEEKFRNNSKTDHKNPASNNKSSFDFFAGCQSLESVQRKYKSLVKLYHPDNYDGDTSALQEINRQYNEIRKDYIN